MYSDVIHYINIDGLNAIVVKEDVRWNYYYTYTDYLGSILKVTDEQAKTIAEQNFDAWGRARNANTWDATQSLTSKPEWLYRGFTGHEHLPEFSLINMNGRLYDPLLARMLSPDNYVQDETDPQNYNRYSYVKNNPLKFVDPSGEYYEPPADYYNLYGNYLGNDGVNDNQVYFLFNSGMNSYFNGNPYNYSINDLQNNSFSSSLSHSEFATASNIVMDEGGTLDPLEFKFIAHTTNNAKGSRSIYGKLMTGYSSSPHKYPLSTSDKTTKAALARAGVIDVLIGNPDPTNGAKFWDGTDFLAQGLNKVYAKTLDNNNNVVGTSTNSHPKFRQYKSISIPKNIYSKYLNGHSRKSYGFRMEGNNPKGNKHIYNMPAKVFQNPTNWQNNMFKYSLPASSNKKTSIIATGSFGNTIYWKPY